MVEENKKKLPPKKSGRVRKFFKGLGIGFLALLGLLLIFFVGVTFYIDYFCIATPPAFDNHSPVLSAKIIETREKKSLGDCWLSKKDGLYRMYLSGTPFVRGYSHARLTQDLMKDQETTFLKNIREQIPSEISLWLLKKFVTWNNRNLPSFVSLEDQIEILGLSRGQRDLFPEIGPLYHRILNYHAAHDISHAVMDSPLVGCTSFAAWGSYTPQGHLLLGRNFDFNFVRSFDTDKIVMKVKPDRGFSYLSVSWTGMIGVVSGINEKKIAITINAAHSSDKKSIGTPVSLVIRQVLLHSSTLQEAIDIIKESKVFVSDCYLIADGKTSQAVIVEKTPLRSGVLKAEGEFIIGSNHMLSSEFSNDPANRKNIEGSTSLVRYNRMKTLLKGQAGKLTPAIAAEILRDSEVPGGIQGAYGNAAAINAMIATHSVIIDVTDGILWVSRGPHQLGPYVPFGIEPFENPPKVEIIPADKVLKNGTYEKIKKALDLLKEGKKALKEGETDRGQQLLEQARALHPNLYTLPFLLGKIALQKGERTKGKKYLIRTLSLYPAYKEERDEIKKLLSDLQEK